MSNADPHEDTFTNVTHLHDMSRMSAPYNNLRKWAICMIHVWANNSECCFLSNFDTLKHRIIILMLLNAIKWVSVIIRFLVNFLGFYQFEKNARR